MYRRSKSCYPPFLFFFQHFRQLINLIVTAILHFFARFLALRSASRPFTILAFTSLRLLHELALMLSFLSLLSIS